MRRQVPLILCFVFGIVMIFTQFIPHSLSQGLHQEVRQWYFIITPLRACVQYNRIYPNTHHAYSPSHGTLAV